MSTFKKLAYKSHYRGTKEGDYLLSSFAKYELENCSEQEIKMYEQLLDYTDTEIQEWVMSPQKTPTLLKEIILKIAAFHKLN